MTTEEELEQLVYEKMCATCRKAWYCHENCEWCDEFMEELDSQARHKKHKRLTMPQKFEIYNRYKSGEYTQEQLCTLLNISRSTLRKVDKEISELIHKKLKTY